MAITRYEWAFIHERIAAAKLEVAQVSSGAVGLTVILFGVLVGQLNFKDWGFLVWIASMVAAFFISRYYLAPFKERHAALLKHLNSMPEDER